jgi:uncharacterized membrane protein
MAWGLASDWLAVAGTSLLTVGTGAQARAALREYKIVRRSIPEAAWDAVLHGLLLVAFPLVASLVTHNPGSRSSRWVPDWLSRRVPDWVSTLALYVRLVFLIIFYLPGNLVEIRTGEQDQEIELLRFLRLTVVWSILMVGSACVLAAACIQLALA